MIRLGINVPNFGPEANGDSLLGWARFADDNGFSTLLVSDHVAPTPEVVSTYPAPFYDPFLLLSWLSARTTRVRLGTSVTVVPYRHPLLTARMSAMTQVLSGSRFVLGVGVGWARTEFEALGLDFAARGATTDAYLQVITEAWAADAVCFAGPGLNIRDVATGPRPTGGRLPVWVGGASLPAMRRAARFGDAWHPINPDLAWLRDVGVGALARICADAAVRVPDLVPRIKARVLASPAPQGRSLGVGTVEQIVADVRELEGLGAVEVILDTNPDAPRPRDFEAEQHDLLDVKKSYEESATPQPQDR